LYGIVHRKHFSEKSVDLGRGEELEGFGCSSESLLNFIRTRMRMAHIYQPVMIRTLLDHQIQILQEACNKNYPNTL